MPIHSIIMFAIGGIFFKDCASTLESTPSPPPINARFALSSASSSLCVTSPSNPGNLILLSFSINLFNSFLNMNIKITTTTGHAKLDVKDVTSSTQSVALPTGALPICRETTSASNKRLRHLKEKLTTTLAQVAIRSHLTIMRICSTRSFRGPSHARHAQNNKSPQARSIQLLASERRPL